VIERREPSGGTGTPLYARVVSANGFVFTAGITARDAGGDVKAQTTQILEDIDRLLVSCGTDRSHIVSATIWVSDIRHRDPMNEVWIRWTQGRDLPGRACIEAKLADPRLLVEIAVIAAR
jgi:enamine deaminase RidA (YjgF/YER057c/UK114 family)